MASATTWQPCAFADRARELRFESTMRVDHVPVPFRADDIRGDARLYPFAYAADEKFRLAPFLMPPPHPEIGGWAAGFLGGDGPPTPMRCSST